MKVRRSETDVLPPSHPTNVDELLVTDLAICAEIFLYARQFRIVAVRFFSFHNSGTLKKLLLLFVAANSSKCVESTTLMRFVFRTSGIGMGVALLQ